MIALKAIRPLVEGVKAIHNSGSVHRDIKPQNIFVADDGQLISGDFGLVFSSQDSKETRLTEAYENVGTRDFMVP